MASSAYEYMLRVSIALIGILTATLLPNSVAWSQEIDLGAPADVLSGKAAVPPLGNTNDLDRSLSREVSDSFIFDEITTDAPNAAANAATANAKATTPASSPDSDLNPTTPAQSAQKELNGATPDEQALPDTEQSQSPSRNTEPVLVISEPVVTGDNSDQDAVDQTNSVWQSIRQSNRLPLAKNDRVDFYEEQYQRESLWIGKILVRGSPFLAHLVSTLDLRFMPVELALLPAIESGFRPTARSAGHAAGLWQIVPITAREIGVHRGEWFDGRGDILVSTTAAIDYLSYLNAEFNGDWELTLAAYNAGPGRVRKAIRKNREADLPTDYWSLDLPTETMNYVPKFLALVSLIKYSEINGFDIPHVSMEPAFESIDIGFRVSLEKAAEIADIDLALLQSLNAGLIHGVTAPDGPHQLLIPAGSGEQFQMAFAGVDRANVFAEPTTHDVVAGDTISSIALKFGISQRSLLNMNGLDTAKIRIGQKLAVLDNRNISDSTIEYTVSIGDTLSEIASKFSVNVSDISNADGDVLTGDVIHPGDTLSISVEASPTG